MTAYCLILNQKCSDTGIQPMFKERTENEGLKLTVISYSWPFRRSISTQSCSTQYKTSGQSNLT